MPFPQEHSCRLHPPGGFQKDSFRRTTRNHDGKKYSIIQGRPKGSDKMEEQAYRYDKTKWTAAEARGHCKAHDGTFEPASDGKAVIVVGARLEMLSADAKLQAKDQGDNGYLEGYASVWDIVDRSGDRVRKGAFTKTIQERVRAGKVHLMVRHIIHGGDILEVIGKVAEAKEDDYGLFIGAPLFSCATAQSLRQMMKEGLQPSLSIGYIVVQSVEANEEGKSVRDLLELKLWEVTVTTVPALEEAVVTAAKTSDGGALDLGIEAVSTADIPEMTSRDLAGASEPQHTHLEAKRRKLKLWRVEEN